MLDKFKKGLYRLTNESRSQSRSRPPTPALAPSPHVDSIVQGATSLAPESLPFPSPAHNTDQTLTQSAPPAKEQGAIETAWTGLQALLGELEGSADVFGPLKAAVGGLFKCVEIVEHEVKAHKDYAELKTELDILFSSLSGFLGGSTPPTMTPIIENIANSIDREVKVIMQKERRNVVERYAEAMDDADEILACYRRIQTLLGRLTLNADMHIWKNTDEQTTELRLGRLPNAPTAMYRSTVSDSLRRVGCTPNTRVGVIEELLYWACDSTSEKVYWLNGMAGTGKTTIAYTICDRLQRARQLGASFFCSRQLPECRDVNRIVPSISYQLSLFSLPFRSALSGVLERYRDVHNQPLGDQFEHLVAVPLRKVADTFVADIVIVIDALDECDDRDGAERMLEVLLAYMPDLCVKFFVTSRPEPMILRQMRSRADKGKRSELHLHELERTIVQQDITTYLSHKLPRNKVSTAQITKLAERSGVLFIYAATVVRYIEYDHFSRCAQRLKVALEASGGDKDIDALYTAILKAAFDDPALDASEREEMRDILCHVVCAQEPLSLVAISGLLGVDDANYIEVVLRPLLSVLNVSNTDGLVTTLHESFPNYLLDHIRSGDFSCDGRRHHARMTHLCFDLVNMPDPAFNICMLESSYVLDEDVPGIEEKVDKAISKALVYACRYWGAHLQLANTTEHLVSALYSFLSTRLLLWTEVLCLKRQMHEGASMLFKVETWCKAERCSEDLQLLALDAYRFAAVVSASPILRSTPHIYVSALAFWPKSRPVSRCYLPKISGLVEMTGTATARQELTPVTISTHSEVYCVAYSDDGRHLASGHGDGSICIWDALTGQIVSRPIKIGGRCVTSVAYCSNSAYIVSGDLDNMIYILDTQTHKMVGNPLKGHAHYISSIACSPDGLHFVSGSADETIRIWSRHTGHMAGHPLEGHTDRVNSVAYSRDGAYIASGSLDCTILIWDVLTRCIVGEALTGHTESVNSVAYSPDDVFIVSGSRDRTIRIWNWRIGEAVGQPLEGHTTSISSVQYSRSGTHIVSGSHDHSVRIWDARSHRMIGRLDGHTGSVWSVSYSPGGAHISSCSSDRTVRIWSTSGDQTVQPHICHAHSSESVTHSPTGSQLGSGSGETSGIWDMSAGKIAVQSNEGHTKSIRSVSYSPDGAFIISGSDDNSVRIWDARTGKVVGQQLEGHTGQANSISYSPNGAFVASGSTDKTIQVWDSQSGKPTGQRLEFHNGWIRSISYSPDGAYLASGSDDNTIGVWDLHTSEKVGRRFMGHSDSVRSVSFSPDSAYIVSGSGGRTLRIWDVHAGQMVGRPLRGHFGSVIAAVYSPDGARIVSGSSDCTVCIWDAHTGQMVGWPLLGHTGEILSVSYSPDGAYIASGSSDGTIRIWDAPTRQAAVLPLSCVNGRVHSVAFSPDGTRVVSGHHDGSIRVWHLYTRQVISDWTQLNRVSSSQTMESCPCSVCTSSIDWDPWKYREDGWIVNERDELLIWVPHSLGSSVVHPHNSIVISRHGTLKLDFGGARLGTEWQRCYTA